MSDLEIVAAAVGERGKEKRVIFTPHPHSSPYFRPSPTPLVQVSFSPQPPLPLKMNVYYVTVTTTGNEVKIKKR